MSIKHSHILDVRRCPFDRDVSQFYGNPLVLATHNSAIESAKQTIQSESDNTNDARERTFATITLRRGQPKFRKTLLEAYEGECAITGCDAEAVLEAAHIMPYNGEKTNKVENGILLRADIHTLFDLNLIRIDTTNMTVIVAPELENSTYAELSGLKLKAKPGILNRIKSALDSKWKI